MTKKEQKAEQKTEQKKLQISIYVSSSNMDAVEMMKQLMEEEERSASYVIWRAIRYYVAAMKDE